MTNEEIYNKWKALKNAGRKDEAIEYWKQNARVLQNEVTRIVWTKCGSDSPPINLTSSDKKGGDA